MKTKLFRIIVAFLLTLTAFTFSGCDKAATTLNNIQQNANNFNVYRKMTFINLYTGERLYSAEGYFSLQTTYKNDYQGQQEIGLVFKVGEKQYKMDYFSIAENVCYVIEQIENTTDDPYYWKIIWYVPIPEIVGA